MKIYVKASKQYDIENTPYSIVDYGSHADVVYTDSLQLVRSFSDYGQAHKWIMKQNRPRTKVNSKDRTSSEKQEKVEKQEKQEKVEKQEKQEKVENCKYVIYAEGTKTNTQALYRKHRGPARYCNGADAERFTYSELPRYATQTEKYNWIAEKVRY